MVNYQPCPVGSAGNKPSINSSDKNTFIWDSYCTVYMMCIDIIKSFFLIVVPCEVMGPWLSDLMDKNRTCCLCRGFLPGQEGVPKLALYVDLIIPLNEEIKKIEHVSDLTDDSG